MKFYPLKHFTGIVAVAILGLLTYSSVKAAPSLVADGGFESTTDGIGFLNGTTVLTNWAYTTGFSAVLGPGSADTTGVPLEGINFYLWGPSANGGSALNGLTAASPSGGNYIANDALTRDAGQLSQTISGLVIGTAYSLSFDFAAAQFRSTTTGIFDDAPSSALWNIRFGSEIFTTQELFIGTHGFSGWQGANFTHIATSATEVLQFEAGGGPAGVAAAALLDSVSVSQFASVPLPSSAVLLGFGILTGITRRRKIDV
jgi:hypothetical protein